MKPRKPLRKKSKDKVPKLKDKLWNLFARWVKERDGYVCQSSGLKVAGRNAQGGHLIPKSVGGVVLYFHPWNVWCQSGRENVWLGGNGAVFAERISKKLGFNITEYLEEIRKKTKSVQWESKDLLRLIEALENKEDYQKVHQEVYQYL